MQIENKTAEKTLDKVFRAYDVRGKYPDDIDESLAYKIGAAFCDYISGKRFVVGADMRLSSPSLAEAVLAAMKTKGVHVSYMGLTTTPRFYYAVRKGGFDGGIMVTASHLAGDINGFKICGRAAVPLSGDKGLSEIKKMIPKIRECGGLEKSSGGVAHEPFLDSYIDFIASFVKASRKLKIVVDAGNGSVGPELVPFFRRFPMWYVVPLYFLPDGNFPHHVANPLILSNDKDAENRVVKERADLGIAFDGDADRVGFVDEKGEKIPEELITAILAQSFLYKKASETIIYDLRSSRVVPETISSCGGKPVRSRVGHSFIKELMRKESAVFAGEMSGHYYFRDTGYTDNALFAMVQVLNILSASNSTLSGLVAPLKKYFKTGEINMKVDNKQKVLSSVEKNYKDADVDHLDGLSVNYDSWWFNLRPSNTEPLLRLNLEVTDKNELESRKNEVIDVIKKNAPEAEVVK